MSSIALLYHPLADMSAERRSRVARPSTSNHGRRLSNSDLTASQKVPAVFIRSSSEVHAMSWEQRFKIQSQSLGRRLFCCWAQERKDARHDEEMGERNPQYRLEASHKAQQNGIWGRFAACICGSALDSGGSGIGMNHSQRLATSLHWMFRVNFIFLFAVMCAIFCALVMFFAGLIIGVGYLDGQCIQLAGTPFTNSSAEFSDAFALSWNTFSSVGYGSTYPALGHEIKGNRTNCILITFITALESFCGVLYSGFCGAILFGKVLRIQSHAQVIFSDPIVIRYGSGVQQHPGDNEKIEEVSPKKIPCPILEFRIVNRRFDQPGGEIMDANLSVVANVDAHDADPTALESSLSTALASDVGERNSESTNRSSSWQASTITSQTGELTVRPFTTSESKIHLGKRFMSRGLSSMLPRHHRNAAMDDDDPSARLVNKRVFYKMVIEASGHPFFKRVWLARHILDDTSPILKPKVRRQIRRNHGYWPALLNSHEAVRDSLQFNQILVSLNGVSNVSASDVYAQKIYDFVDMNVGYQFVNILYKDHDSCLKVDVDLINDVREQRGGGGEPLILGE